MLLKGVGLTPVYHIHRGKYFLLHQVDTLVFSQDSIDNISTFAKQ